MHMHARERLFACKYEGCSKNFSDRGELIQHENSHESKNLHPRGHKACNQAFEKPFQLHHHHREEHEKTVTAGEESRPIRLRLSQPKRPNFELLEDSSRKRLLIRLPMKKNLRGTSNLDPTEAHEHCAESKNLVKRSANRIWKQSIPHCAPSSYSSSQPSSTLEANRKYQVSSHGPELSPAVSPHIPTPNVRPQAPASQPTFQSRSAEHNNSRPYTDGHSNGHGNSVYTRVCGVYSKEKASPVKLKTNGGPYRCPRCDSQFTRARGVMRHFPGCISKYGNPDTLKWTDYRSLRGTVKFYARNGHQGQEDGFLQQALDAHQDQTESREVPHGALLRSPARKPLTSAVEENRESVQRVYKPLGRDALQQNKIVRPIHKRRDALRRSNYNSETIARDVLLAMGSHPYMDPLNAHLDTLRKKFRAVNLESNVGTLRWDLLDPEQEPEHQPEYKVESEISNSNSSKHKGHTEDPELSDAQWYYDTPSSLRSGSSIRPSVLYNRVPFGVSLPEMTHFGPMSTVFSSVFDRDASAKLMSSNGDLWAAIFTMLERRYQERSFLIRAAVRKYSGDVIGWVACHEVDPPQARSVDISAYLDWTTAAHLLPPQISRFTVVKENVEERAERSNQREVGQGLASTIQARATEAQLYLVPVRRLVINALVVHPLHQGLGVASALLKSITEIADMQKNPIWIQAPEDPAVARGVLKAGLFRRAGFTCAGELNLDLGSYTGGLRDSDKEKGVTFGPYKWNYMLRWPQPVVTKSSQRRSSELEVSV